MPSAMGEAVIRHCVECLHCAPQSGAAFSESCNIMETTVIHFSGMQLMLMLALCAVAVLLPVWAIRRIARAVPPACRAPGVASGVGGLLLLTIVLLVAEAVNALYHFGRAAGEAARIISMSADYLWPVVQTMIPDFAASFFLLIAIGALVFGRSPRRARRRGRLRLAGRSARGDSAHDLSRPSDRARGRAHGASLPDGRGDPLPSLCESAGTHLRHGGGPQACAFARRLRWRSARMKPSSGA